MAFFSDIVPDSTPHGPPVEAAGKDRTIDLGQASDARLHGCGILAAETNCHARTAVLGIQ
jgi:hypothetical protein